MRSIPIVGSHFHPPASEVLKCVPAGTPLVLVAEPTNPYDDKAIRVYVDLGGLEPTQELENRLDAECQCRGWDAAELLSQLDPCWLGFLPKSGGKTAEGGPGNGEVWEAYTTALLAAGLVVKLGFTSEGKPCVDFTFADALDEECGEWAQRRPFNE